MENICTKLHLPLKWSFCNRPEQINVKWKVKTKHASHIPVTFVTWMFCHPLFISAVLLVNWQTKCFYISFIINWPGIDRMIYRMKDSLKSFFVSLINLKIFQNCWLLTKLIQGQKFRHIKSVNWLYLSVLVVLSDHFLFRNCTIGIKNLLFCGVI